MQNGYQILGSGPKVQYLINLIRCDKLSKAVTTVQAHPDKFDKDVDIVVTILTQYINKNELTPSVKVAFAAQTRSAKQQMTSPSHVTYKLS